MTVPHSPLVRDDKNDLKGPNNFSVIDALFSLCSWWCWCCDMLECVCVMWINKENEVHILCQSGKNVKYDCVQQMIPSEFYRICGCVHEFQLAMFTRSTEHNIFLEFMSRIFNLLVIFHLLVICLNVVR